ncbi:MAG: CapA family protein [Bacteroidetes bacterium]|nr:CapA family protein [Bacteroidota bacterium]MDA1336356.1 CapA family protein [Bacteroidota bacterium]
MKSFILLFSFTIIWGTFSAQSDSVQGGQSLRIMAVGDLMLGTNYPSVSYLPPNGGKDVLADVDSLLNASDLTVGNLEGVIRGAETPAGKKCSDPKYCYLFKSPDEYVEHFVTAGFDFLCVANNHINDFGTIGREHTLKLLDQAGIKYAGVTDHPTTTMEVNGIMIGVTGFSPNRGTLSIHDYDLLKSTVESLDAVCDIVIVSFHGGAEGPDHQHVTPGNERYIGENRGDVIQFARAAIDAGADVVLGHGPHVARAVDLYKDRFIAYSLGNFSTYGRFNLKGPNGYAPILDLRINADGSFESAQIHSAIQRDRGVPRFDAEERAYQKIKELTLADRPDAGLVFPGNGLIEKK